MLFKVKYPLNEIDLGLGYTNYSQEKYITDTIRSIEQEKKLKKEQEEILLEQRTKEEKFSLKKDYIYSQKVRYGKESIKYINNLSESSIKSLNEVKNRTKIKNDSLQAFIMLSKNCFTCLKIIPSTTDFNEVESNHKKIIEFIKEKKSALMKLKYHHLRNTNFNNKELLVYNEIIRLISFNEKHLSEIENIIISVIEHTIFNDLEKQINEMTLDECVAFRKNNKL